MRRSSTSFERLVQSGITSKLSAGKSGLLADHNGSRTTKNSLSQCPLDRVRKADEPKRNGRCPKFLSLQRPDIFGPVRNQAPPQSVQGALFGFWMESDRRD